MNEVNRNVWDDIYASGGYQEEPDQELVSLCSSIQLGKAFDVGAGDGRHSLWLAARGWEVDAVDISSEGIASLQREAHKHGLTINTWVASMAEYTFRVDAYGLAISTGSALNFLRKEEAKDVIAKLQTSVHRGGYVYITLSTVDDPAYQRHRAEAGGVQDDAFWSPTTDSWINAFQPGELRRCFSGHELINYAEKTVHDTHGGPHEHVMAFVTARRPEDS